MKIRISRELNDDVAPSLSLLAIELGMLSELGDGIPADIHSRIVELSTHRVSHELHPAMLEQLGVQAAIRAFVETCQLRVMLQSR
jgi:signal transduction histidine kinase